MRVNDECVCEVPSIRPSSYEMPGAAARGERRGRGRHASINGDKEKAGPISPIKKSPRVIYLKTFLYDF